MTTQTQVTRRTDEWLARGYDVGTAIAFAVADVPLPRCPDNSEHHHSQPFGWHPPIVTHEQFLDQL